MRLIVGISGATGAMFGIRLLQMLLSAGVKTDLILSEWAKVPLGTQWRTDGFDRSGTCK
jgi:4-hydroxy-3-polyprenylbenzoate decarboxylase